MVRDDYKLILMTAIYISKLLASHQYALLLSYAVSDTHMTGP